jgi:hypothetical protein
LKPASSAQNASAAVLVEIPAIKSSLCGLGHIAAEDDPVKRHLMDERHMARIFGLSLGAIFAAALVLNALAY